MNHDYTHCADYEKDCPKDCFRAELMRDLEQHKEEFAGIPFSFSNLRGTEMCPREKED